MKDTMVYIKADSTEALQIANLHKTGIPTGFLSKQSSSFLEALYRYLIEHEIVYVAKDDDTVVGFIAVSANTSGLYKRFLKSNFLLLFKFALKNVFSIDFLKKAYETLNAPKKVRLKEAAIELPELLSIVIDDTYIGKGLGKELLSCVEKDLSDYHDKYKVLVGSGLEANHFYQKNGFVINKEVELGSNGFEFVKESYDREKLAERYMEIIGITSV